MLDSQQRTVKPKGQVIELNLDQIMTQIYPATDSVDQAQTDSINVVVLGEPRAYGKKARLSAQHIAMLFKEDINALYAQLAGRFVVIISELKNQKTHVINDHLASIPFYYSMKGKQLRLTDRLSNICQDNKGTTKISPQALYHYCYFHCIPAPMTIYQGVCKMKPAEWLEIDANGITSKGDIYRPHFSDEAIDEQHAQSKCIESIEQAVELNLTEQCGAFLSGGLDSSTVSGMLAKFHHPAKTFSVGFNEPGYDETHYAEITANKFGTQHHAAYLEPQYIADNFNKVATSFDEPFGNSSALAAYFCASYAKEQGIDTLLAGDGGDELFAGNSRYAKQKLFFPYENAPNAFKKLLKLLFVKSPLSKLPGFSKASSYIQQAENPLPDRLQAYNFLHRFSPSDIFTPEFLANVDTSQPIDELRARYQDTNANSPIDKMLYLDWKFTLADNDLIKVSKMCELAGVDVKFPLIEKELADFSCTLPASTKLPGQKLRQFFKNTVKGFLAEETLNKSKHGFGLPFGRWMRSNPSLIQVTQNALESLRNRNIVKSEFIDTALQMQQEQHSAYYGELIWILTVLELWLQSRGIECDS
ncbi:asparagine synthetase B family protein [Thalassotalea montiporae]